MGRSYEVKQSGNTFDISALHHPACYFHKRWREPREVCEGIETRYCAFRDNALRVILICFSRFCFGFRAFAGNEKPNRSILLRCNGPASGDQLPGSANELAFLTNSFSKTLMLKQFVSKRAALAAAALLCCGILFLNSNARAQCPTGYSGPYYVLETCGCDGCSMAIVYCINCATASIQIEGVYQATPGCSGCEIGYEIYSGIQQVIQDPNTYENAHNLDGTAANPCGGVGQIPLCGQGAALDASVYVNSCWEYGDDAPSFAGYGYYTCPEDSYCELTYKVCRDQITGQLMITNESSTNYGTNDCPLPPSGPWVPNICYQYNACSYGD